MMVAAGVKNRGQIMDFCTCYKVMKTENEWLILSVGRGNIGVPMGIIGIR